MSLLGRLWVNFCTRFFVRLRVAKAWKTAFSFPLWREGGCVDVVLLGWDSTKHKDVSSVGSVGMALDLGGRLLVFHAQSDVCVELQY